jgi:hypothetical protein
MVAMTHELALLPRVLAGAYEQYQLSACCKESSLPKARLRSQFSNVSNTGNTSTIGRTSSLCVLGGSQSNVSY